MTTRKTRVSRDANRKAIATTTGKARVPGSNSSVDRKVDAAQARINGLVDRGARLVQKIGEYVLKQFFDNDPRRVFDPEKVTSPAYQELMRRAATGAIRLDPSQLSRTVAVAAWNRSVSGGAWETLDYSLKVELLPLADRKELAAGAKHAIAWDLSARELRAWVQNRLTELGRERQTRERVESIRLLASRATERFSDNKRILQLQKKFEAAAPEEQAEMLESLEALRAATEALLERLRG